MRFDPSDHYWFIANDAARLWSSARSAYVEVNDATYLVWQATGGVASRIANEFELDQVLRANGLSIGRAFAIEEVRAALAAIDAGKVRAALGRDDITTVRDGDAEQLARLVSTLQPASLGLMNSATPEIEGIAPAETLEERFTAFEAAARAREAELIAKGLLDQLAPDHGSD